METMKFCNPDPLDSENPCPRAVGMDLYCFDCPYKPKQPVDPNGTIINMTKKFFSIA